MVCKCYHVDTAYTQIVRASHNAHIFRDERFEEYAYQTLPDVNKI